MEEDIGDEVSELCNLDSVLYVINIRDLRESLGCQLSSPQCMGLKKRRSSMSIQIPSLENDLVLSCLSFLNYIHMLLIPLF